MNRMWILAVAGLILTGCVSNESKSMLQDSIQGIEDMQVIGQAEYVTVLPSNFTYRARMDTGATTCSISALEITQFERDGEKWVRFRLPLPGEDEENLKLSDPLEYPLARVASIKRHGADVQLRPVVKMKVRLGRFEERVEFTLTDRSKYEFPILVGRNLLEGNAVIDVSQSYAAETK